MKKLLFAAYTLDVGGIETALVTLLNKLQNLGYDITLVLEKKQGIFLNEINKNIKIIEYSPSANKNKLLRRFINLLKRVKFILKYKNKFDFSASFATYSLMSSFCARQASKNSALWVHSNYSEVYQNDETEILKFFEFIQFRKFKNIVCVSENSKQAFEKVFEEYKGKVKIINNLIDYQKIIDKSNETEQNSLDIIDKNVYTFLNVSRHDETAKKITRLIEAANMLKNENYKFQIILVGEGKDTELYKELVSKYELDSYIKFEGEKKNPYPYFKISDAVILTSDYEGYPVVFNEALALGLPIITTNVSDAKKDIDGKFGVVVEKDVKAIFNAMEDFILNGYELKEKFDAEKYNKKIIDKLEKLF